MDGVKEPREVSGWGPGCQDFSDIARPTQLNAEADPAIARETTAPRGAAPPAPVREPDEADGG